MPRSRTGVAIAHKTLPDSAEAPRPLDENSMVGQFGKDTGADTASAYRCVCQLIATEKWDQSVIGKTLSNRYGDCRSLCLAMYCCWTSDLVNRNGGTAAIGECDFLKPT